MALSLDEVKRIAALANLRLSPEEEQLYVVQLGRIVDYVDQLRSRDGLATDGSPSSLPSPVVAQLDVSRPGLARETVLDVAPRSDGDFVVVPRIHPRPAKPGGGR